MYAQFIGVFYVKLQKIYRMIVSLTMLITLFCVYSHRLLFLQFAKTQITLNMQITQLLSLVITCSLHNNKQENACIRHTLILSVSLSGPGLSGTL